MAFSKISEILGTTKNSVIGKAHRLGIFIKPETENQKPRADIYAKPAKPARPAPKPASAARHISLGELGRNECRYPVGKDKKVPGVHLFCGTPTHQKYSYCETHHNIVWKPAPVRVR
jgi:GcrA cell cycle regulator